MNLREAWEHFGVREWGPRAPLAVRILRGCTETEQGCWVRTTSISDKGYGTITVRPGKCGLTHREMYRLVVGPIPPGLDLDHLCRVTACCNPAHLEPVTHAENLRRGKRAQTTHCPRGHEYDEANTYNRPSRPGRVCRRCANERNAERRRLRAA